MRGYAEMVRGCSSRNNEGVSFSEKLVSTEDISKNSVYKRKINNGASKTGLSEHHGKVSEVHRSTDLEK